MSLEPTELLVCVKCRGQVGNPTDDERAGRNLHNAIADCGLPDGVTLRAVECLQNCDHGCSIALRGGSKRWTYVYGNVEQVSHLDTLIEGAALYHETEDGLIPWRSRPEHFKRNCIARVPPLEITNVES